MSNLLLQPINSTILHIRSKDATQLVSGFNTDFNVNLVNPININQNEEVHISMMSAEVPYSFYNLSSDLNNNILKYDTTETLTFVNQDYSVLDVRDFFNNNTAFANIFTTTYDTQKNKLSFLNKTGATHTIDLNNSSINKVIGFDENDTQRTITAGSTLESDYVCNLATIHSIFVKSSMATGNVISTRIGNSTTLQKISVDVNSNGIIYLNQSDFRQVSVSQSNIIDSITFRITDQNDNLLQLNNVNFELSFLFEVFPRYNQNNENERRSRSVITTNKQSISDIPTQPMVIGRQNGNNQDIDDTHPIQGTSAIEHASNRLVLDNLLQIVEDQG